MTTYTPARLSTRDTLRVGATGLRTRPLRAVLSALGIAIGIATMVAVLGISSSNRADLLAELDRLGTNLLTASPGNSLLGGKVSLPERSVEMTRSVNGVKTVGAVGATDASIRRTDKIPATETGGVGVSAATPDLLRTLDVTVVSGTWLNAATARYPAVVLGSVAADRLGVQEAGTPVWIDDRWYTVTGILGPAPLAPDIERSALVGWQTARDRLGFDGAPTTIYERSTPETVEAVRAVLAGTIDPEHPEQVDVSRPSDALAARAAADKAFTGTLLGLGVVALLVGGIGVANTMVISVLERRREIGLRRSLGATRGQIRTQFLTESLLLSSLGGVAGAGLGALVTAGYAFARDVPVALPWWVPAGALAATLLVGTVAGLYPAARASRVSPTVALAA
ncbi:putative ABC transporter permease YknZ [Actinomadura rubteroloni]|uniref:Putative ABC transporter permease YknZ n=1 Tax=Actinomadura rubteroloni TaxID=1926885 RepID=A0A2P4UPI2_9ACTN|nr:ABC transporter permease [Actinomadura rubteroloni]POM26961.1 putative ABC transporter permease YknZ [Actinomadura rubteroloni]